MSEKCGALGVLTVGGRVVGRVVCDLDAGHESATIPGRCTCGCYGATRPATPHAMTLTWAPEINGPDVDLLDPAEHFDTDVPFDAEPGECGTTKAGYAFPESAPTCSLPAGHDGPHVDAGRPYAGQW